MKVVRKYTAVMIHTKTVDDEVNLEMSYGRITGPYYDREHPKELFNTEDEAIKHAYSTDNWATWLIVPVIKFDNFD